MSELRIEHVDFSFGKLQVLRDVSFSVAAGEFVCLLGPSGSGKSTLFGIIGGILKPDRGAIWLNGENITGKTGYISYTPQSPSLMPWRTILDNVLLGQEIHGVRNEEAALSLIERAGLKGFENRYPHELSGGMKQRASFIRSLLSPQSLILLDEPFSALDEFTRLDMQKWLLSIWSRYKKSILFVTHNIDEAIFLSDRILVLSAKPATVKAEFAVPFARPRQEEILLSTSFLDVKREILQALQSDSIFKNR